MTIVTVELKGSAKTIIFDPPLPPAREIQILNFCMEGDVLERIFCDIVDPLSSYSSFMRFAVPPSRLLGFVSLFGYHVFPNVKTMKTRDPIREMKISFVGLGDNPYLECPFSQFVVLKIHH